VSNSCGIDAYDLVIKGEDFRTDLGDLLHAEMVYPSAYSHLS